MKTSVNVKELKAVVLKFAIIAACFLAGSFLNYMEHLK